MNFSGKFRVEDEFVLQTISLYRTLNTVLIQVCCVKPTIGIKEKVEFICQCMIFYCLFVNAYAMH